jgi:hypothetical protein
MAGKAADMHFIDDGSRRRQAQRCVALPVVSRGIHYHALHRRRTVVASLAGGSATVAARNNDSAAVWVEEQLCRIESHAVRGILWPLDVIAIDLAKGHARNEYVPVVVCAVRDSVDADCARGLGVVQVTEEQQFDPGGILRIIAEVDAAAVWPRLGSLCIGIGIRKSSSFILDRCGPSRLQ